MMDPPSSVRSRAEAFVQQQQNKSNNSSNPLVQVWDSVVDAGAPESRRQEGYGRPPEGSLTEERGIKAHLHVHREMDQLCQVIREYGVPIGEEGDIVITFGQVFKIYVSISDKVVGLLLRARKHGLVDFEGEMLFQRRDEEVPIVLRKVPRKVVLSRSPSPNNLCTTMSKE